MNPAIAKILRDQFCFNYESTVLCIPFCSITFLPFFSSLPRKKRIKVYRVLGVRQGTVPVFYQCYLI